MKLNLELEKAVEKINQEQAKTVLIQLPDGLKPKAEEIKHFLEEKTEAKLTFWAGSCYGACDVPNVSNFDLLIQFGHSEWR